VIESTASFGKTASPRNVIHPGEKRLRIMPVHPKSEETYDRVEAMRQEIENKWLSIPSGLLFMLFGPVLVSSGAGATWKGPYTTAVVW
jgi:hypothetical protein